VWTLADWFHVFHNDEPLETLAEVAPRLRHIHVPVPPIADAPEQPTDPGFDDFLDALLATGYDLRMSVEDNGKRFTDFPAQAGPALDYLRARVPAS
jgi:sugar phosphate isomerase/epimerase